MGGRIMPFHNKFKFSTCNSISDSSGFKEKLSDLRMRWDGYLVSKEDWEPRPAGDFPVTPRPPHVFEDARLRPDDNVDVQEFDCEGTVCTPRP